MLKPTVQCHYLHLVAAKCILPDGTNTIQIPEHLRIRGLNSLEMYKYTCIDGYETTDDVYTTCLPDGRLSLPHPPSCKGRINILCTVA